MKLDSDHATPDPIAAWRVPEGKMPKGIFNPRDPAHKGNMVGFPKFHITSPKSPPISASATRPLDVLCSFAHVAVNRMLKGEKEKVHSRFAHIYSGL